MRPLFAKAALSLLVLAVGLVVAGCGDQDKRSQLSPVPLAVTGSVDPDGDAPSIDDGDSDGSDDSDSSVPGLEDDGDSGTPPPSSSPDDSTPTIPPPSSSPDSDTPAVPSPSGDPDEIQKRAKELCERNADRARETAGDEAGDRIQRICDTIGD